jgi:hypothetical protein
MVGDMIGIGKRSDEDKQHRQILKIKASTRGLKRKRICPGVILQGLQRFSNAI